MALGTVGLMIAFGNGLSFLIFTDSEEFGISPFLLIAVLFMVMSLTYIWIPETLGMESKDQI